MSQSPLDAEDTSRTGQANAQLASMLNRGSRSFSGNEKNCAFLNTGGDARSDGRFANVSALSGLDFPDDARAISVVDWDHDGDQDIWISNRNAPRLRFLRNDGATTGNYIALRLFGNGTTTNRDAIGARVEVFLVGSDSASDETTAIHHRSVRSLRAGEGFLAQSSKWIHFGLGQAAQIDKVVVRWPGDSPETFENLVINRRYHLVQGASTARDATSPARDLNLVAAPPTKKTETPSMRVPLVPLLRMPNLNYLDFSNAEQSLAVGLKGPLLINLWSTTCKPCLTELNDFTKQAQQIREAGIRVAALSIERLEQETPATDAPKKMLESMGFPFEGGFITEASFQILYEMKKALLFSEQDLPLPASFLVDASGQLSVIYLGPVSVEALLEDVHHSSLDRISRYERSAALSGRVLEHTTATKIIEKNELVAFLNFADALDELGLTAEADSQFEVAVRLRPTTVNAQHMQAEVLFKWSNRLVQRGQIEQAIGVIQQATKKRPGNAKYHYNLGVLNSEIGKTTSAQQHYQAAVQFEPKMISAHRNLARLLAQTGQWNRATHHFEAVVRIHPQDADSRYNWGVSLAKQSRWQEAAEQFRSALTIRPNFPRAQRYLEQVEAELLRTP